MKKNIPYARPRIKLLTTGHLMQGEMPTYSEIGDEGELARDVIMGNNPANDNSTELEIRNVWDD